MSEHVLDWLSAYYDGELHGDRRRWVEAHLSDCPVCQGHLAALQTLTVQLQAAPPMPARTPPEQFVAQVRLRLPARSTAAASQKRVRQAAGLWLPLSVVVGWAFGQAALLVSGLALALTTAPQGLPLVLAPLPGLGTLTALLPASGWGGWVTLVVLEGGLTAGAAVLVAGCLAAWWAARETKETSMEASGLQAG